MIGATGRYDARVNPRLLAIVLALGLSVLAPAVSTQQTADPLTTLSDQELLARAGEYVRRVMGALSTVVLEERYVQVIKPWSLPPKTPDTEHLAWFDDLSAVKPDVIVRQRRQTRSDVLLVQLPNRMWTAFRDTFEVNGRRQGNREDRLRRLFVEQTEDSQRQLRRINERSSDWNLGRFYRDINMPTTGLLVIHAVYQPRFAFERGEIVREGPVPCRLMTFKETTRPTLVRSVREQDVPLSGNACIDGDGVVWKTRIDLDGRFTTRGSIEVSYGRQAGLDVLEPERMWEWYLLPEPDRQGFPLYVEALATYSNLRQFSVTTHEQVK